MTNLSPAALGVVLAWLSADRSDEPKALAAALRAVADQTNPEIHIENIDHVHQNYVDGWKDALYMIINIAAELEAQS